MARVIGARYEVVSCLGSGSLGTAYLCTDRENSGQQVALKVIYPEFTDGDQRKHFEQALERFSSVSHDNLLNIFSCASHRDLLFYTMEYVDGGNLSTLMDEGELTLNQTKDIMVEIATGLQALHLAKIIHRDIKPENILLSSSGTVKVSDFGFLGIWPEADPEDFGGIVETLDYVCPEYLSNGSFDIRSDIYAFGILAYELVTGAMPVLGNTLEEVLTARIKTEPTPPKLRRANCPESLSNCILKALAKDPENRHQSATELIQELNSITFADQLH